MPALVELIADQIAVTAIGAAGQPTNIVPTVNFDRKVILHSPAVGVFISHAPITRTPSGFQLPAGLPVEFDVPAGTRLYAITAAGTIQVSRYMTTIVATTGDVSALTKAIQDLIGWTKRLAGVR
jgi:hypothetical protein